MMGNEKLGNSSYCRLPYILVEVFYTRKVNIMWSHSPLTRMTKWGVIIGDGTYHSPKHNGWSHGS